MEFLSDDQVAAYERFVGDLTRSELEGFFLLDMLQLLDGAAGPVDVGQVWAAVEQAAGPQAAVVEAVATVAELVPDPDSWEAGNRQAIAARYRVVRPFVRLLAEELPLGRRRPAPSCSLRSAAGLPGCCAGGWIRSR